METRVFATAELAARQVCCEIKACLAENPRMHLCIAAGDTSLPLFHELIKEKKPGAWILQSAALRPWMSGRA